MGKEAQKQEDKKEYYKKVKKVKKMSIQLKILIPSGIIILLLCAVLGLNSYRHVYFGMMRMGVEEADMASYMALTQIDGDMVSEVRAGFETQPEYQTLLRELREVQKNCKIAYLYTLYEENDKVYYGIDTDESEGQAYPGKEYEDSYEELSNAFAGNLYIQDYIDSTQDGDLITVYKPIKDSEGNVVAVLGCDYDASSIVARLTEMTQNLICIVIFCIVTAFFLLYVITYQMRKGLLSINAKIYDLVCNEGDLTQTLECNSGDEMESIADNVNLLLAYIREIMLHITADSGLLETSARTISKQLGDVEGNIVDVSSTMEQMSASMEESNASLADVNASVVKVADVTHEIARQSGEESDAVQKTAAQAKENYTLAMEKQENVKEQADIMADRVAEKIREAKAVERIKTLTEKIIEIADQTSLLSLNASIEAARAGDSGRGFAVVASEIGNLASTSAATANEIRQTSETIIQAVYALSQEAASMIQFLEEETIGGYARLLDNSQEYQNNMQHLSQVLQEFTNQSTLLENNMERISESVQFLSSAVEENTLGITNVTEAAVGISQAVTGIDEEAVGNSTIAERLNLEVKKFKV